MCVCLPNAHLFILIEKPDVNEVYKHALRSKIEHIVLLGGICVCCDADRLYSCASCTGHITSFDCLALLWRSCRAWATQQATTINRRRILKFHNFWFLSCFGQMPCAAFRCCWYFCQCYRNNWPLIRYRQQAIDSTFVVIGDIQSDVIIFRSAYKTRQRTKKEPSFTHHQIDGLILTLNFCRLIFVWVCVCGRTTFSFFGN